MQQVMDAIMPIIVVIAVISGIITSIREAAAKKAKAADAPPDASRSRAQAEIAAFLSGKPTTAQRPSPRAAASQQTAAQSNNSGGDRQKPRQKKQKNQASRESGDPQRPLPSKSQGSRPAVSSVKAHVDSFIGDHVKSHMGRDVDAFVQKDMGHHVKSNLGNQSGVAMEDPKAKPLIDALVLIAALRSPEGVRQAIVVNEILSRPKALRNRNF